MRMRKFWDALVLTVTEKLSDLLVKLSRFASPQYLLQWMVQKFREQLSRLLDVKPRHSNDYHTFLRWMVSRRLVNAIVILLGIACLAYLFWLKPIGAGSDGIQVSTYRYRAIPLRLAEGKVRIRQGRDISPTRAMSARGM